MLKNENYETSIYSHLARNDKWKIWVRWHGSSWWLLCLCVLCFVFCAASKTIQCSQVSPYFIFWKMKIMSYVFRQISSSIKLRLGKITKGKKDCVSFFGECSRMSPYFIFWKMKIMSYVFWQVSLLMKLWPEKVTTGKKSTMLVYLVLWGNSFWYTSSLGSESLTLNSE